MWLATNSGESYISVLILLDVVIKFPRKHRVCSVYGVYMPEKEMSSHTHNNLCFLKQGAFWFKEEALFRGCSENFGQGCLQHCILSHAKLKK